MAESVESVRDERLLRGSLRLNGWALGALLGLLAGLALFLATNWLVLKGAPPGEDGVPEVGPHLALLGQYFLGYRVTFLGSLVGFAWAFAFGAISGAAIAGLYNRLAGVDRPS